MSAPIKFSNVSIDNSLVLDGTSTESFLARKDSDGGDVFGIDTTNNMVLINGDLSLTNSKMYSYSGSITGGAGELVLSVDSTNAYYHIKMTGVLHETSNAQYTSTLQFESTGAAGTGSALLSLWNISVNNPTNPYPWSTTVTSTTSPSYQFSPNVASRNYSYTLMVTLVGTASLSTLVQDGNPVKTW